MEDGAVIFCLQREEKDRGQGHIRTWKQRLLEPPAKATLTCDWASFPTHAIEALGLHFWSSDLVWF